MCKSRNIFEYQEISKIPICSLVLEGQNFKKYSFLGFRISNHLGTVSLRDVLLKCLHSYDLPLHVVLLKH